MANIFGFISNLISEAITGILHLLSSPFILLYNLACWILDKLMEAISSIGHLVTLPFIFLYNLVCSLGIKLKEAIIYTGDLIILPFSFLYNFAISIWGKVKECPSAIMNAMAGLWNMMKDGISSVGNLLSSPFVFLGNLVSSCWVMIKNEIASIWEFIIEEMTKPMNYIGGVMSSIWVKFKGSSLVVWDFVFEKLNQGMSSLGGFMSFIWIKVIKMVSSMGNGVTAVVIYPVDKIKQHPYVFGIIVLVVVLLVLCWYCPGWSTAIFAGVIMVAAGSVGAVSIIISALGEFFNYIWVNVKNLSYCPGLICWSMTIIPGVIMVAAGSIGAVWLIKVVLETIGSALGEFFGYILVNVKNSHMMIEIVTYMKDGANAIALYVKIAVKYASDEMKQHPYLLCEFFVFLVVILALRWYKPTLFRRIWRVTTTPAGLPIKIKATSEVTEPLLV